MINVINALFYVCIFQLLSGWSGQGSVMIRMVRARIRNDLNSADTNHDHYSGFMLVCQGFICGSNFGIFHVFSHSDSSYHNIYSNA